jgi:hypothetical protein
MPPVEFEPTISVLERAKRVHYRSRDNAVGIRTGQKGRGSRTDRNKNSLFPWRSDRFWNPPGFLSNGFRGLFLCGKTT